jgi:hypothetical protein
MERVGAMSEFCEVVCNCVKCVCFMLLGALCYGDPMSCIALCVGVSMPWLMGCSRYCCLLAQRSPSCCFGQEIQGTVKGETIGAEEPWHFVVYFSCGSLLRSPVITLYTTSVNLKKFTFCPLRVFVCFVWIWEQIAIISLYSINWLVCRTETECAYCAVRTGSLYTILRSAHTMYLWVLCGSENKQRLLPYTTLTDWF